MSKQQPDKTAAVLDFIIDYFAKNQKMPTVREIQGALGYGSSSSVHHQLVKLVKAGEIELGNGRSRSIRLLKYEVTIERKE